MPKSLLKKAMSKLFPFIFIIAVPLQYKREHHGAAILSCGWKTKRVSVFAFFYHRRKSFHKIDLFRLEFSFSFLRPYHFLGKMFRHVYVD